MRVKLLSETIGSIVILSLIFQRRKARGNEAQGGGRAAAETLGEKWIDMSPARATQLHYVHMYLSS